MKRLAILVLLLLVVALSVLLSLPFSEWGTRFLVDRANLVDGLDIRLEGGRLAGQLDIEQLSLAAGLVQIELNAVSYALDSSCLWRSAACFTELSADSLAVVIAASDKDQAENDSGEKSLLRWPMRIEAPTVSIGELRVEWPGGHWHQGELRAGVTLFDSRVQIDSGQISGAELRLMPSADEQAPQALTMPEIFLPLNLVVNSLSMNGFDVVVADVTETVDNLGLTGRWRGHDLRLDSLAISSARGELALSGDLAFVDDWPLTINADVETLPLGDYGAHTVNARLRGDLSDANLKLDALGTVVGSLDADLDMLAPGIPFSGGMTLALAGDYRVADFVDLPESASDLALLSPVVAQVEGDLSRQRFVLEAELRGVGYEQLQLRAEGTHGGGAVLLETVELRDAASGSDLRANGRMDYGEQLAVSAAFESSGLTLPQVSSQFAGRVQGTGKFSFVMLAQSWQLAASALALDGQINDLPAALSGHLLLRQGGRFGDTRLQGTVNGAVIQLAGDPAGEALLQLQVDEFARWHDQARGGVNLVATRPAGSNRFDLEGQLQQPAFGLVEAVGGSISGFITPALAQFDLAIDLESPGLGGTQLAALLFRAAGSLDQHRVSLRSRGDVEGELSLTGGVKQGDWRAELAPTRLDTRHGQWSLAEQVSLGFSGVSGALSVQGHCWRHPQLAFCLGDTQLGASGELEVTAMGDIAAFNGLVPPDLKLKGALDASVVASWKEGATLLLDGQGRSTDVSVTRHYGLGDDVTISWDSLTSSLRADEAGMAIAAEMQRGGRPVFTLGLMLPPERDGALQGQLQLKQMGLDTLAPLAPELSRLEGELNGELKIAGKPGALEFSGPITLSEGSLALEGNPTEVTDLELSLLMHGDDADIHGQALLGGGELSIDGTVQLSPEVYLWLDVSGSNHQILVPPSAELVVSEDLIISVVPGLIDVRGEVRVTEGVLHHEQLPAGSVALSPDVIEVDLTGSPIVEKDRWDVRSDVWIRLRDRFRVEGDNLNATLGGDLHMRQEPGKPLQLFGNLNILGGELQAYRQQLIIRRGTVAFSGDPGNPELDVRAERDLREQGVTVGASLQGSLDEPRLDVYSDPPMSQGETMSYLVRGRGLDSGAGADGTALALAMGASVVNQSGILAPVNRLPGISDVSFGSTGTDDDTAATVSGYLGERIYLSYGIGLYEPINVMTARLYLQSRLWVEVVSRLENSVDIYYSFDID